MKRCDQVSEGRQCQLAIGHTVAAHLKNYGHIYSKPCGSRVGNWYCALPEYHLGIHAPTDSMPVMQCLMKMHSDTDSHYCTMPQGHAGSHDYDERIADKSGALIIDGNHTSGCAHWANQPCDCNAVHPTRGFRKDVGTPPFSLLIWEILEQDARVYKRGAENYGLDNWRKGLPYRETMDHVFQHIRQYFETGPWNEEDKLYHLAQARWGLGTLLFMDLHPEQYSRFNDIHPKKEGEKN